MITRLRKEGHDICHDVPIPNCEECCEREIEETVASIVQRLKELADHAISADISMAANVIEQEYGFK